MVKIVNVSVSQFKEKSATESFNTLLIQIPVIILTFIRPNKMVHLGAKLPKFVHSYSIYGSISMLA